MDLSVQCCMQCSPPMPLWNSCSAAAHRRLHQQRSPLVCPECGVTCQLQNLNTHLNQSCMHYSRRLGYRYPNTSHTSTPGSCVTMKTNAFTILVKELFFFSPVTHNRCPCCHLVFGGVNSLNAVKTHMQTAHCEVFHKCPSCPMAFKAPSGAETHCINQHPELPETARQSKWV